MEPQPTIAKLLINCLSDLVGGGGGGDVKECNQLNERVVELENVNRVRGKVIGPLQCTCR